MAVRIVSDSACDLPAQVVEDYGIEVLPLYINMEGKSLMDGVDISRADFYSRLPNFPTHPTTSTPGVELIRAKYEELIKKGATGIISIHIAGALSNMVNLAQLAAKSIKGVPVRIIDSGQISLGIGLQVLAAAKANLQGKALKEITDLCSDLRERTWSFAALNTLEFIHRGGRISSPQYNIGRFLNIKPLIIMHDGELKFERVITFKNSIRRIISVLDEIKPLDQVACIQPLKSACMSSKPKPQGLSRQVISPWSRR
jgi:DegV family protein with EDD domain